MINYQSTRGAEHNLDFKTVVLQGLAKDKGLFVPEQLPQFSRSEIASFANMSYIEVAEKIILPFVKQDISNDKLLELLEQSYKSFNHKAITPLVQTDSNKFILELFHGPSLAFKDVAMQLLGQLLPTLLNCQKATLLAATSGDTGSAALEGFKNSNNINKYILFPHRRVSELQRLQMTTIDSANSHCLAIKGTFDDCQNIVKQCFNSQQFNSRSGSNNSLLAVNSINWARIIAQIVYYFYAASRLGTPLKAVSFAVPSGNFGNVLAGYYAKWMGLPIQELMVAANQNDILHRCIANNDFSTKKVVATCAPSMDISIPSNFERLVFDLCRQNSDRCAAITTALQHKNKAQLTTEEWQLLNSNFSSASVNQQQINEVIVDLYTNNNYLIDPHSAIAYSASNAMQQNVPIIVLATAHPAKFTEAIKTALSTDILTDDRMQVLNYLKTKTETYEVLDADIDAIQEYIGNS